MNLPSVVVLAFLLGLVGFAVWRNFRKGAPCSCGCSHADCACGKNGKCGCGGK